MRLDIPRVAHSFAAVLGLFVFAATAGGSTTTTREPAIRTGEAGLKLVSVADGRALRAELIGPESALNSLTTGEAEILSQTAGDVDSDGMPDLVIGYEWQERGLAVIHRGNIDSLWPDTADADERRRSGSFSTAPFLSPARVIELPARADFLGVGDFDGDGYADLAVAASESNRLHFVLGNGNGGFQGTLTRELPGKFTSAVVGEINRRDGIADLAVAVTSRSGARVLVFEGPAGAAMAEPEVLKMPDTVTSIVLGHLDEEYNLDLAAASGRQIVVVYGRDRRLSQSANRRADVLAPRIESFSFRSDLSALSVGDYLGPGRHVLACLDDDGIVHLLDPRQPDLRKQVRHTHVGSQSRAKEYPGGATLIRTRISGGPGDDLLVVDPKTNHIAIVESSALKMVASKHESSDTLFAEGVLDSDGFSAAVLPMRLTIDALDDLVVLAKNPDSVGIVKTTSLSAFTVNSTACENDGDTTDGICDTGNADDGYTGNCTWTAATQEAYENPSADTVLFDIAGSDAVIDCVQGGGSNQAGGPLTVEGGSGRTVQIKQGVRLWHANSVARGLVANYIATNLLPYQDCYILIEGNYVGTNHAGTASTGPNGGIGVECGYTTVGGTVAAARNVVAHAISVDGVLQPGIGIEVVGNYCGIGADGTSVIASSDRGIAFGSTGVSASSIGGTTASERNVVAGYLSDGLYLDGIGENNLIQGNYIGTDPTGSMAIGNGDNGIAVFGANNTIGGTVAGGGNVIAASDKAGILVHGPNVTDTLIQGNLIGTDASGMVPMENLNAGIWIYQALLTTIGGVAAGAGNLISGHADDGADAAVLISAPPNSGIGAILHSTVQGNLIGTDITGSTALPNKVGIWISDAADNTIGGAEAGAANVIASSTYEGVQLSQPGSHGNIISGNFIGTNEAGDSGLGNGYLGVNLSDGAAGNVIGGFDEDAGNVIAENAYWGVILWHDNGTVGAAGTGNAILSNSIHSNGYMGIDLGPTGVTANDPQDPDSGPNNHQNFPELTRMTPGAGNTSFDGVLDSTPLTEFTVQVFGNTQCDPTGHGEGEIYLGSVDTTTNAAGMATFSVVVSDEVDNDWLFTATATDAAGNTSEFSPCLEQTPGPDVSIAKTGPTSISVLETINYTVTVRNVGSAASDGVQVTDDVPECLTNLECETSDGACSVVGHTVTVNLGLLQPEQTVIITITGVVDPACHDVVINTAEVEATSDINLDNNIDTAETTVLGEDTIFTDGFETGDLSGWSD